MALSPMLADILRQQPAQEPVTRADVARMLYAVRDAVREAAGAATLSAETLIVVEWCVIAAISALLSGAGSAL